MTVRTHVYKTVSGCSLNADVYTGASKEQPRPVLIMIHGGALIVGDRRMIDRQLLEPLLAEGFVVVSIDYRLAPETKLPDILDDVRDAYRWVREEGPALFHGDSGRVGVQGCSAGGYLTLMTGFCVDPRPRALVSFCGYGDIAGDWYARPDPFYCQQPLVSEKDALAAVGERPLAEPPEGHRRGEFYLYCRQQGLWPLHVAGHDPRTEPRAFDAFCPIRHVASDYPPTLLAHGDRDTDVPYQQSVDMAAALAQHGVTHTFMTLENAGHGIGQASPEDQRRVLDETVTFLVEHLKHEAE